MSVAKSLVSMSVEERGFSGLRLQRVQFTLSAKNLFLSIRVCLCFVCAGVSKERKSKREPRKRVKQRKVRERAKSLKEKDI